MREVVLTFQLAPIYKEKYKGKMASIKKENEGIRDFIKRFARQRDNRIRCLEQCLRENNVVVSGIPVLSKENIADIVHNIGA